MVAFGNDVLLRFVIDFLNLIGSHARHWNFKFRRYIHIQNCSDDGVFYGLEDLVFFEGWEFLNYICVARILFLLEPAPLRIHFLQRCILRKLPNYFVYGFLYPWLKITVYFLSFGICKLS